MKAQLLHLLKYSNEDYDLLVFDIYYCWCMEHGYSITHLQKLLNSQKLYSWFMREYRQREARFLDYTKDYQNSTLKELRDLYDTMTCTIDFYPKAILNDIRKQLKKTETTGAYPAVRQHLN